MDLTEIAAAMDDLYHRCPHLPRREDLAQVVLDAYSDPGLSPDSPWRLPVVAALWPIGAAAGAERGHTVMAAAIRDEVAQALEDPTLPAGARWVVMNFVRAADDVPDSPDAGRRYTVANAGLLGGDPRRLDHALSIGLLNSWRAGHSDATEQVLTTFADKVAELVGHDRLRAPLIPTLTGDDLLYEIAFAAGGAAAGDRDRPPPQADRPTPPGSRPVAARAFAPLRSVDPGTRTQPITGYKPQTGPGRPGPGR